MDIAISLLAIALLAPFMLVIAALIRLTMGGPPIFAQQRVGCDGTVFTFYKFRSTVVNAEEVLRRHLATNPSAAREWRETRKLQNDPTVNCLGNILRKSGLDELLQIFNVLCGHMSIVGPRPVLPGELGCYRPYWCEFSRARPGLTGIWQVNGLSYSTRVALDRYYIRKWSIWLDLAIMVKTVPALLNFDGAA